MNSIRSCTLSTTTTLRAMMEHTAPNPSTRPNSPVLDSQIIVIDHPPTTPKNKNNVISVANVTPQSGNASSHGGDQVTQKAENIDVFVTEDLKNQRTISFQQFLDLILALPGENIDPLLEDVSSKFKGFDEAFEAAFAEYAKAFGKRHTHERCLYVPLAKLMNTATMVVGPELRKVFYVQDQSMVVGAIIEKSPDLCAIWANMLELESDDYLALISYL